MSVSWQRVAVRAGFTVVERRNALGGEP